MSYPRSVFREYWAGERPRLTYVPVGVEEARVLIAARVGALPPELTLNQRRRYLTDGHLEVEETLARVERRGREGDVMPDF